MMLSPNDLFALAPEQIGLVAEGVGASATIARTGEIRSCFVDLDQHETTLPGAWKLLPLRRWALAFQALVDVRVGDRVTVTGFGVYGVCAIDDPRSQVLQTVAHAYRLYDTAGAVAAFPTTHSLQIRRDIYNSSTKQSVPTTLSGTVALYVEDISNALRVQGFSAEYGLQLICDGAVDLRDGDRLLGYAPGTTTQTPVVLVQHVAHHQMAGWDYKTALAKAVTP